MAKQPVGVWGIDLGQCGLKAIRLTESEGKEALEGPQRLKAYMRMRERARRAFANFATMLPHSFEQPEFPVDLRRRRMQWRRQTLRHLLCSQPRKSRVCRA